MSSMALTVLSPCPKIPSSEIRASRAGKIAKHRVVGQRRGLVGALVGEELTQGRLRGVPPGALGKVGWGVRLLGVVRVGGGLCLVDAGAFTCHSSLIPPKLPVHPPCSEAVWGSGAGRAATSRHTADPSVATARLPVMPEPSPPARRGLFIAFEGGDGAGKSTQVTLLARRAAARPAGEWSSPASRAGHPSGAQLRDLVLHGGQVSPRAETLLFAADKAQHVHELVRPALERGEDVLTDRYTDSSIAYQGVGRDLGTGRGAPRARVGGRRALPGPHGRSGRAGE